MKSTRKNKPSPHQSIAHKIDRLSMWEWDLLVGAWRNYEHGATITSASFPYEIVRHYWGKGNNYTDAVRQTVANQFAIIDHGRKGEKDWTEMQCFAFDCDLRPWTTFYRFCEAEVKGYHTLVCKDDTGTTRILDTCFHVDYTNRWIDRDHYIKFGDDSYINPEFIIKQPKRD